MSRSAPLRKLVELAAKYPEIGPPLADLSFAIGETDTGNQLVRMGTERDEPELEYWFVAVGVARREKRYDDVLESVSQAVKSIAGRPDKTLAAEEQDRLLHLIRTGFATLMFDLGQLEADAPFITMLGEAMPGLDDRLGQSPFYRTLKAQTIWFSDRDASEAEWDRAVELGDSETTWNARGTWYNEAEKDPDKAEKAYRKGLEATPNSALLMHNVAQLLVDKAKQPDLPTKDAHRLLNQATELLRQALRQDAPRLRRHIHATRDRLEELRRKLPAPPRKDSKPRHQGKRNDSPRPKNGQKQDRPAKRSGGAPPQQQFLHQGTVSLGEMILAKLNEKKK